MSTRVLFLISIYYYMSAVRSFVYVFFLFRKWAKTGKWPEKVLFFIEGFRFFGESIPLKFSIVFLITLPTKHHCSYHHHVLKTGHLVTAGSFPEPTKIDELAVKTKSKFELWPSSALLNSNDTFFSQTQSRVRQNFNTIGRVI